MILKIASYWQVPYRLDAKRPEMIGRTNSGQHQDLRRTIGSSR